MNSIEKNVCAVDDVITISDDVIYVSSSSDNSECNKIVCVSGGVISISSGSDGDVKMISVSSSSNERDNVIDATENTGMCTNDISECGSGVNGDDISFDFKSPSAVHHLRTRASTPYPRRIAGDTDSESEYCE